MVAGKQGRIYRWISTGLHAVLYALIMKHHAYANTKTKQKKAQLATQLGALGITFWAIGLLKYTPWPILFKSKAVLRYHFTLGNRCTNAFLVLISCLFPYNKPSLVIEELQWKFHSLWQENKNVLSGENMPRIWWRFPIFGYLFNMLPVFGIYFNNIFL